MNAVSTDNLTVRYGDQVILDRLSFAIPQKSITAIIGPNGSGKTTLLKALLDLIPHQGTVRILGTALRHARSDIGYVPQRFTFDASFPITVTEYISLAQNKKDQTAIDTQLTEVGMQNQNQQLLGQLSGGQLQRILVAKALVNQPKILFLDEPAAGIDISGERNFYELIQHLNEEHGVTILVVSHEIDIVYKYATQVICLNKQMLCMGKPQEVLTSDTLKNLYGQETSLYQHAYDKHD